MKIEKLDLTRMQTARGGIKPDTLPVVPPNYKIVIRPDGTTKIMKDNSPWLPLNWSKLELLS